MQVCAYVCEFVCLCLSVCLCVCVCVCVCVYEQHECLKSIEIFRIQVSALKNKDGIMKGTKWQIKHNVPMVPRPAHATGLVF